MIVVDYSIVALVAYLLGSIPFGLILTRLAGLGDIRAIGSGNIGATNVMRTGHKKLAIATLLLDAGKGALAVMFALVYAMQAELSDTLYGWLYHTTLFTHMAMLLATLGHVKPIWLKFKGGKGVATAIGTLIVIGIIYTPTLFWQGTAYSVNGLVPLIVVLVWITVFLIWRMSSLSSLCAIWSAAIVVLATGGIPHVGCAGCFYVALALLITYTHRENIKRIRAGTEHRFVKKSS
ncbi:MAG: glycerol-3-phosphate 1-O-acyltransferase PlsY [Rickettsiales bacterium]|nr:glycerol-3-phosphate 1-O-acyltransferase PlsY [Rickettsiales bacterium]